MHDVAWWVNVVALLTASAIDLRTRRIPNWLTLPFLVSGVALQSWALGWRGLRDSLAGIGLAIIFFGIPCFLKGMGLGDLKLGAGVAAWVGPSQATFAFVLTGVAGGVMAVAYLLRHGLGNRRADRTGFSSTAQMARNETGPSPTALSIPYGPAIAAGALFSFFAR